MAICALLNIGVLFTNTLNLTLSVGYSIHFRSLFTLGWCRFNTFVAQWIRGMASWFLVIVAFDRYRQSKSVRRTPTRNNHTVFYTIFVTCLVLFLLNLHYLLFIGERIPLNDETMFLACIFFRQSRDRIQRFFAATNTWQELVIITIVVSSLPMFFCCLLQ